MLRTLKVHEADRSPSGSSSSGSANPGCPERRAGRVAVGVAVTVGAMLGALSGCAEPQQSVKRYQPTPTARPAARTEVVETPTTENYEERAEAIRRVCNRKASTDLGRCWSDEAGRKNDPKFEARVTLEITVSPEGRATEAKVLNPNGDLRALEQCIVDSARGWNYPSGQATVPVQCPFFLRPGV